VADAVISVERMQTNALFEIAQLPFRTTQLEMPRAIDNGDPRRIVSAVLEFPKTVDYQRHDLFVSNVSDNSTHKSFANRFSSALRQSRSHSENNADHPEHNPCDCEDLSRLSHSTPILLHLVDGDIRYHFIRGRVCIISKYRWTTEDAQYPENKRLVRTRPDLRQRNTRGFPGCAGHSPVARAVVAASNHSRFDYP
jgi:hypothetical protein